jgi:hypothetical protein
MSFIIANSFLSLRRGCRLERDPQFMCFNDAYFDQLDGWLNLLKPKFYGVFEPSFHFSV